MRNIKFNRIPFSVIVTLIMVMALSFSGTVSASEVVPECNTEIVAKNNPRKVTKKRVVKRKRTATARKKATKKVTKKKRTGKTKRRVVTYDDSDADAEEEAYDEGYAFGVEDKLNGTRIHECIVYDDDNHQEDYEDGYYDGYFSTPDPKKNKKKR